MKSRALILALPLLAVVTAAMPAQAGESMAATVRLNVRAGPGLDNAILDVLSVGERVLVNRCLNDWCQITRVGMDGWVYAPYLVSARFSKTWRAASRDLPATLGDTGIMCLGFDASTGSMSLPY